MQVYRCPIDDCVFTARKEDRVPTLEGHPECPGPVCTEKFAGYFGAAPAKPSPTVVAPSASATSGASVSTLQPPPVGQGW